MESSIKVKVAVAIAAALCACAVAFGVMETHPTAPAAPEARDVPASVPAASAGESASGPAYEPGVVLASLADGVTADQAIAELASAPALAGIALDEAVSDTVVKLALPAGLSVEDAVSALAGVPAIEAAQPNHRLYTQETANLVAAAIATVQSATADDPAYVESEQWGLPSVNASTAWDEALAASATTEPVTVAVVDAGFYVNHEDLKDNLAGQYDATTETESIEPTNPDSSQIDHGTHAAGIVAARTNNALGVASISYNLCRVLPIRVQDDAGTIYDEYLVSAYDHIISHAKSLNIKVVNMSLGGASYAPVTRNTYSILYDQIAKAREAGIVTVVSACNSGTKGSDGQGGTKSYSPPFYAYPSDFDNVVSVIALTNTGTLADNNVSRLSSSNYNVAGQRAKNISAPGEQIYGLYGGASSYGKKSGTSMAAPLVAGVMGLMFRVNPNLTPDQATQLLYDSARDLTQGTGMGAGWDVATGYGEVDAAAAVAAAASLPAPEPEPAKVSLTGATITLSAKQLDYTGKKRAPTVKSVTLTVNGAKRTLKPGTDYTVSNPGVKKGTGTVVITGKSEGGYEGTAKATYTVKVKKASVYALYNGKTGEWFYTTSSSSRLAKLKSGWASKGVAWSAPTKSTKPVYYQKKSGKTLYTTKKTKQGIAFYSVDYNKTKPVYRYYNVKTKTYRYSTSKLKSSTYKRQSTLFYAL